jgi:hypothetical protein
MNTVVECSSVEVRLTEAGLANRIRGWAGGYALSTLLGIPLNIHWQPTWQCPGQYNEVFDIALPQYDGTSGEAHRSPMHLIFSSVSEPKATDHLYGYAKFGSEFLGLDRDVVLQMGNAFMRDLQPAGGVQDIVSGFQDDSAWRSTLGVHLRGTDHEFYRRSIGVELDYGDVARQIEATVRSEDVDRVFLACDDARLWSELMKSPIAGLVVNSDAATTLEWVWSQSVGSSVQSAGADLFALAKCERQLLTPHSSFSYLAALIARKSPNYFTAGEKRQST